MTKVPLVGRRRDFLCNRFGVREFDFIALVQLAYKTLYGGVLDPRRGPGLRTGGPITTIDSSPFASSITTVRLERLLDRCCRLQQMHIRYGFWWDMCAGQ
jgi:hypothetical protein